MNGIPSPTWSGFSLGPLTIHAYALCILTGILVALWLTNVRWQQRGGTTDDLWNIAVWTVPAGIIGGRLYHIFSTPDPYFGPGGNPVAALYIWNGGLGIWGAVALGVLVAYLVSRRYGIRFLSFIDAAAPGLILAQAIGRWGNWFNQELFGAPTQLPWGLHIDKTIGGVPNPNWPDPALPADTLFHPTFLYESVWNLVGAALLIWAGKKFLLGHGQVFYAYICYYTLGRVWIEALRIDTAEHILGLRLNVWTSILVFILGATLFVASRKRYGSGVEPAHSPERIAYDTAVAGHAEEYPPYTRGAVAPGSSVRTASSTDDSVREVGFGPQTTSLPIVADDSYAASERPVSDRSFGFYGAVTSTISIVPQVADSRGSKNETKPV